MSLRWLFLIAAMAVPSTAAAESDWEYTVTLYSWILGVNSVAETPFGEVEVDLSFEEILEVFDIGVVGSLEARNGKWSLIGDLQYYDLGAEAETPAAPFISATVDTKITILGTYAVYAVVDDNDLRFDVGGGLRFNDLFVRTQFSGGPAGGNVFSNDATWVDLLVAARLQYNFNERWRGFAFADYGGFGIGDSSDPTWQVAAGAAYQFNEKWSAIGGYRHLAIDRDFGRFATTIDVTGPFLGFQASF